MTAKGRPEQNNLVVEPLIHSLDDLLSAISELDLMIATRYHGILLSLALDKPVLGIAYHEKSRDLMNWLGQGNYVMRADTFSVETLIKRFPLLEAESGSITHTLHQQNMIFRAAVQAQYDEIFKLVEGNS
jgi:polysaccharide pyruvyl transferase WcaK-like protein